MRIIFLAHPAFLGLRSMERYAELLVSGMAERGHITELWQPQPRVYGWSAPQKLKKWLGYIDQYVVFPYEIKQRINRLPKDTLFVLTDHALGAYAPLVTSRPHVVHCHDFLAQRSALGELPENPTSWTGRQYQTMIRKGFSQARNFISISDVTHFDLHKLLSKKPAMSEVVHNSLPSVFVPATNIQEQRCSLQCELDINLTDGFLLHVGGNQWYKNREGTIHLYSAWRASSSKQLPLLMVGEAPSKPILQAYRQSNAREGIHFLTNANDAFIKKLYQSASLLLFPSLAEGFGWPILEAMASGCPVITTNQAPMTEVGGQAAFLIPRRPSGGDIKLWADDAAGTINRVLNLSSVERDAVIEAGLLNAQRFNSTIQLDKLERLYETVLNRSNASKRFGLTKLDRQYTR